MGSKTLVYHWLHAMNERREKFWSNRLAKNLRGALQSKDKGGRSHPSIPAYTYCCLYHPSKHSEVYYFSVPNFRRIVPKIPPKTEKESTSVTDHSGAHFVTFELDTTLTIVKNHDGKKME